MRIVFLGTPELAVPSLAAVAARHVVAAVVCQPDKPQGRSKQLVPPPVKVKAGELGIPVHQPVKLNDGAFESWLREQEPEACVLVAYGRILKQPILDVPKHGFLNMHPSLLPRYRGPSPIFAAVRAGDEVTGITIMRLDAGMDTGDILVQETAPIEPADTTETLSARLADHGASMLVRALDQLASGTAVFTPQDHSQATVTRMIGKKDGDIDWNRPADEIHNLVRAAVPWPVATAVFNSHPIRIHQTQAIAEPAVARPGTVEAVEKKRILLATGEGRLALLQLQAPGKRVMTAAEFLNGNAVHPGDRFESPPPS